MVRFGQFVLIGLDEHDLEGFGFVWLPRLIKAKLSLLWFGVTGFVMLWLVLVWFGLVGLVGFGLVNLF